MKSQLGTSKLLLSCEHASNRVPYTYQPLLGVSEKVLNSHRGYDPGAIETADAWHQISAAPLFQGEVSRLLIDLNRSLHHRHVWSKYALNLSENERQRVLERYYHSYRKSVEAELVKKIKRNGSVVHISVHSFTPVMNGIRRAAQVGILYDPQREKETNLAKRWQAELQCLLPHIVIRRNYPYRGTADGFTVALRRKFVAQEYSGIELELRQDWVKKQSPLHLAQVFHDSLLKAMNGG